MNILYTWVGNSDLKAPDSGDRHGPIADALRGLSKERKEPWCVVLLQDYERPEDKAKGERYLSWLEGWLDKKQYIDLGLVPISKAESGTDPTSYIWVYDTMRRVVNENPKKLRAPFSRHYLVGPGTPTMAACTIILSRLKNYHGSLWQTDERSRPLGYRKLELPFGGHLEEVPDPQSSLAEPTSAIILESLSTKHAWELAERAANSALPVLILGSTGTGKEEIAKHIHKESKRCKAELVTVNCGAIPPDLIASELFGYVKGAFTGAVENTIGVFETAQGGTVFLDEIGELPLAAQAALLRVLQNKKIRPIGASKEREVDFRVVAATHRNLWEEVKKGTFREDLYYRLACIIIKLEDLQDRQEDLFSMIEQFWKSIIQENGGFPGRELTVGARERLLEHQWPGNVRELKSTLTRMAFLARDISVEGDIVNEAISQGMFLRGGDSMKEDKADPSICSNPASEPFFAPDGHTWKEKITYYRRYLIETELQNTGGNKTQAAKKLGISAQQLARILKERA